jgi:SAM-dependent methyltransferase
VKFPVNFLAIEEELKPISKYLQGNVLNAGCGDRDITKLLKGWHAEFVDNCDIQSSIPGAFQCDLAKIPKSDNFYDSILCNAVLEHVPDPESVMTEFHRLLKPGGYLAASVPFLQPFHPTPFDFRRYTQSGLQQLGSRHGFRLLEINPVHSLAQTVGWILWAHLEERKSYLGKLVLWLPIYLVTRLYQYPLQGGIYTANSFQAVFERE